MKNIYKIHYIVFFLALFFSKAKAEPTFVQSKLIDDEFYLGLNFNNDGTKMYTVNVAVETSNAVLSE